MNEPWRRMQTKLRNVDVVSSECHVLLYSIRLDGRLVCDGMSARQQASQLKKCRKEMACGAPCQQECSLDPDETEKERVLPKSMAQ